LQDFISLDRHGRQSPLIARTTLNYNGETSMKHIIIAVCITTLSACGSSSSGVMKPGKWRTTTEIESFEAPGMPASAVEQMKSAAKGAAVEYCLSAEMASAPGADMFAPKGGGCQAEKMEIKDGKIDAKLSCSANGAKQEILMAGTIEPEIYTLHSTVKASVPGMGETKTVTKVESKRIGDC
jgi:hypothetical protein